MCILGHFSIFYRYGIADFRRFLSIFMQSPVDFFTKLVKMTKPTRQCLHNILGAIRQISKCGSRLIRKYGYFFSVDISALAEFALAECSCSKSDF